MQFGGRYEVLEVFILLQNPVLEKYLEALAIMIAIWEFGHAGCGFLTSVERGVVF